MPLLLIAARPGRAGNYAVAAGFYWAGPGLSLHLWFLILHRSINPSSLEQPNCSFSCRTKNIQNTTYQLSPIVFFCSHNTNIMHTKKYLLERRQDLNYVERLNTYFDDYLIYETPSKFEQTTRLILIIGLPIWSSGSVC